MARSHYRLHPLGYQTWKALQRSSLRRGIEFKLTMAEVLTLLKDPCWYCQTDRNIGLDRLDNSKGYEVGNCLPACTTCNMMKGSLKVGEFLRRCHQIRQHHPEARVL